MCLVYSVLSAVVLNWAMIHDGSRPPNLCIDRSGDIYHRSDPHKAQARKVLEDMRMSVKVGQTSTSLACPEAIFS